MFRIEFNKLRFLICDDNPHMRRILRTLLHSFGAREVWESEDGATALEMYSHYVPDIVITDWSMPIFDGLELAQPAPVHQDQDLFRPGPPAQYEQHLYRTRAPRRRRGRDPSAAIAARQGPLNCLARAAKEIIMAKDKPGALEIKTFADHHVITQPNPLQNVLRRVAEQDLDDPVARAEKALAGLSGEFKNWMGIEADRLSAAHAAILRNGFTKLAREELFRAAHDIKGDAATFGYPSAGAAAESLCRIIEHAPDLERVPSDLIAHHINAIQAIVRERTKLDTVSTASELSRKLRGVADEYLTHANRDRPEHLEAILAPSIAPGE
jgi:CheY-like chemotaxis protein/HPt (histidine-containing phosphotransfer) domain-containing protein